LFDEPAPRRGVRVERG